MGLENLTGSSVYISDLNEANPVGSSDQKSEGDDHIRGTKNALKNTFPNITGAVTKTHTQLNEGALPEGSIIPYAGSSAPSGWLLCGGQAVSRSTYSALFNVIGTTYGAGDGSTTFNLPDLRGRVIAGQDNMDSDAGRLTSGSAASVDGDTLGASGGAEEHVLTQAQMPNHNHGGSTGNNNAKGITAKHIDEDTVINGSGTNIAFVTRDKVENNERTNLSEPLSDNTDHSHNISGNGSSNAHTNVQPTLVLNYLIKH